MCAIISLTLLLLLHVLSTHACTGNVQTINWQRPSTITDVNSLFYYSPSGTEQLYFTWSEDGVIYLAMYTDDGVTTNVPEQIAAITSPDRGEVDCNTPSLLYQTRDPAHINSYAFYVLYSCTSGTFYRSVIVDTFEVNSPITVSYLPQAMKAIQFRNMGSGFPIGITAFNQQVSLATIRTLGFYFLENHDPMTSFTPLTNTNLAAISSQPYLAFRSVYLSSFSPVFATIIGASTPTPRLYSVYWDGTLVVNLQSIPFTYSASYPGIDHVKTSETSNQVVLVVGNATGMYSICRGDITSGTWSNAPVLITTTPYTSFSVSVESSGYYLVVSNATSTSLYMASISTFPITAWTLVSTMVNVKLSYPSVKVYPGTNNETYFGKTDSHTFTILRCSSVSSTTTRIWSTTPVQSYVSPTLILSFTFPQTECQGGLFTEDLTAATAPWYLSRQSNDYTQCYNSSIPEGYLYSAPGFNVLPTITPTAVIGTIGNPPTPSPLSHIPPSMNGYTMEFWFTNPYVIPNDGGTRELLLIITDTQYMQWNYFNSTFNGPEIYTRFFSSHDQPSSCTSWLRMDNFTLEPEEYCVLTDVGRGVDDVYYLAATMSPYTYADDPYGDEGSLLNIYLGNRNTGILGMTTWMDSSSYSNPFTQFQQIDIFMRRNDNLVKAFNGGVYSLQVWNTSMSNQDIRTRFEDNLPRISTIIPIVVNGTQIGVQGVPTVMDINTTDTLYIADAVQAYSFTILSPLPTQGYFSYEGVRVTTVPFTYTNATALTYTTNDPHASSIPEGSTTCDAALALDTLYYYASTRYQRSTTNARSYICIQDTPDRPTSSNVVTDAIALGNYTIFSIPVLDIDIGTANESVVRFFEVTGTYGILVASADEGTTCDEGSPLVADTGYPATTLGANPQWTFCYWANGPGSAYGNDTFPFQVEDNTGLVSALNYTVTAVVLYPVQGCSVPSSSPNEEGPCTVWTNESVSVQLQLNGYDWRIPVEEQDVWFRVVTLPEHGVLYLTSNLSERVNNHTLYRGNLTYVPTGTYYNRVGPNGFATLLGTGLDGCITPTSTTSCPCPLAVAPGCPDTFTFVVLSEPSGETSTEPSTFTLYVEVVLTTSIYLHAPSIITVAGNETYRFNTTDTAVYIIDPDADLNWIGLDVSIVNVGVTGMDVSQVIYRNLTYYLWTQCAAAVELGSCGEVQVFGTATKLNEVLTQLYYMSLVSVRKKNAKLAVSVYKTTTPIAPNEAGTIPNLGSITNIAQAVKVITMNSSDPNTDDSGSLFYYYLFVVAIICGFGICICAVLTQIALCAINVSEAVFNVVYTIMYPFIFCWRWFTDDEQFYRTH